MSEEELIESVMETHWGNDTIEDWLSSYQDVSGKVSVMSGIFIDMHLIDMATGKRAIREVEVHNPPDPNEDWSIDGEAIWTVTHHVTDITVIVEKIVERATGRIVEKIVERGTGRIIYEARAVGVGDFVNFDKDVVLSEQSPQPPIYYDQFESLVEDFWDTVYPPPSVTPHTDEMIARLRKVARNSK